jgi:hypothetical protein
MPNNVLPFHDPRKTVPKAPLPSLTRFRSIRSIPADLRCLLTGLSKNSAESDSVNEEMLGRRLLGFDVAEVSTVRKLFSCTKHMQHF